MAETLFMAGSSPRHTEENQSYCRKAGERMYAGADHTLFKKAAELRRQQTHAEEILWSYLRIKPQGFKFRRQHPFSNYILDFYCHQLRLVIEVDGPIHQKEEVKRNDEIRERHLKDNGLSVLRFTNEQLILTPEEVTHKIEQRLALNLKPKSNIPHRPKSPL